jgi:signal transduction histidine kinase
LSASLEERERLSRQVHDGAIQVLALVARRGREIGGDTAQLAALAGEQERALRRLVSAIDVAPRDAGTADLAALLRRRASDRVSVSVPAEPVLLDSTVADELVFMDAGVVVERGRPREIMANPQHERTQAFLSKVM